MRQGGEPQGVQIVRQGEPTPYHCDFNSLYFDIQWVKRVQAAFCRFGKQPALLWRERFGHYSQPNTKKISVCRRNSGIRMPNDHAI